DLEVDRIRHGARHETRTRSAAGKSRLSRSAVAARREGCARRIRQGRRKRQCRRMTRVIATGALALPVSIAFAHGAGNADDSPAAWSTELSVILPLLVALAFYPVGLTKLWRRAGAGRGISIASAATY